MNNRDIPALLSVRYTMENVKLLEERIAWQRGRIECISQCISGMPKGGGYAKGFDEVFAQMTELEVRQLEQITRYVRAVRRAEHILQAIKGEDMRQFSRLFYVENLSGQHIRRVMRIGERRMIRMRETIEMARDMKSVGCE